jgi:hypothetical protein
LLAGKITGSIERGLKNNPGKEDLDLTLFDSETLALATNNFSVNKSGRRRVRTCLQGTNQ